eukprot:3175962-Heterocapsa_arctica.AAC.1
MQGVGWRVAGRRGADRRRKLHRGGERDGDLAAEAVREGKGAGREPAPAAAGSDELVRARNDHEGRCVPRPRAVDALLWGATTSP